MADLKKYRQTRTYTPKWNDVHKDPDPIVITFRVPTRGDLLKVREAEDTAAPGTMEGARRIGHLEFLREHVTAVRGLDVDDPLATIHEHPALSQEVVSAVYASAYVSVAEGNA